MQLCNESRLLKCFNVEKKKKYFLSGKALNVFLLKGNVITGIVEPFMVKYSNETSKQTVITAHEFVVPGSWERQMAFSSHPCGDISILWAFAEIGGWDKEPENM